MSFGGVSWKIFRGVALPVLAIFALVLVLHLSAVRQIERLHELEHLTRLARHLATALPDDPGSLDPARRVLGADGITISVLRESDAAPGARAALVAEARRAGVARGERGADVAVALRVAFPAIAGESAPVVLLLEKSVAPVDWKAALGGPASFAALALAALTIVLLLAIQRRRLRSVVVQIAHAARRLSTDARPAAAALGGPPEFRLLTRALDTMRQRLASEMDATERERRTFESLLSQLREGVILAGPDGNIRVMNPAAIRLLGLRPPASPNAFNGLAVERAVPQLDLQLLLRPAARRGAAPEGDDETRLRIDVPLGAVHLLVHATDISLPARDDGETEGAPGRLVVLTDITARTQSLEMQASFVANASHELRTPLSTVRAAVETLQGVDLARETDAARRFIAVIDRQSARLEALATDLLDLSRVESQQARFTPSDVVIAEFLQDLAERFAGRVSAKQLTYESADGGGVTSIRASVQLLRLTLENLIDNAITYTPARGTVRVRCVAEGAGVRFEVEDTGVGIAPDEQSRVFERFYQVERARSGPERGTGLGLSIVRQAVRGLGGEVRLESRLGAGTRVSVSIPQSAREARAPSE